MTRSKIEFWDQAAEQSRPTEEAIRLIESAVSADQIRGHHILDGGCGTGEYTAALAQLGANKITAFDFSAGRVIDARAKTPSGSYLQASLSQLPFQSDLFDFIWLWGVLHYVPDWASGLRETVRVLRPGGTAIIHTYRSGFWASIERTGALILGRSPQWVENLILDTGDRAIPLVSRLVTGKSRPQTSKKIREKLKERLFVPGGTNSFTPEQIQRTCGPSVVVDEIHPAVSDLLNRGMSMTVQICKRS